MNRSARHAARTVRLLSSLFRGCSTLCWAKQVMSSSLRFCGIQPSDCLPRSARSITTMPSTGELGQAHSRPTWLTSFRRLRPALKATGAVAARTSSRRSSFASSSFSTIAIS
eukprot:Amastigsp_a341120_13.p3 type:complete len:112 gc:universal Amastigsp_a341120_13:808-1143(+)